SQEHRRALRRIDQRRALPAALRRKSPLGAPRHRRAGFGGQGTRLQPARRNRRRRAIARGMDQAPSSVGDMIAVAPVARPIVSPLYFFETGFSSHKTLTIFHWPFQRARWR